MVESALYNELTSTDLILKYLTDNKGIKKQLEGDIKKLNLKLVSKKSAPDKKERRLKNLFDMRMDDEITKVEYLSTSTQIKEEVGTISESIKLVQQELAAKTRGLKNIGKKNTTKNLIINSRNNRNELQAIFRQIINKVIFCGLDKRTVLATVYIALNGIVLKNTLKLVLDIGALRKKPAVYKYQPFLKVSNEPVFKNNILVTDLKDLKQEIERFNYPSINEMVDKLLPNKPWYYIEPQNIITM